VGKQAAPRTRRARPRCAPGEATAGPCEGVPSCRASRAKPGPRAHTSRASRPGIAGHARRAGRPASRRAGDSGWPPRRATGLAGRARHVGRPTSCRAGRCATGQVAERGSPSADKSRAERDEGEGVGKGALGSPKRGRFVREARWGEENGKFLATWAPKGEEGRFEKMNRRGAAWWVGGGARVSGEGRIAPGGLRVREPAWVAAGMARRGGSCALGGPGEEVRARLGCGAPGGPRGHARSWAAGARRVGYGELGCGVGCALAGVVGGFSLFYYFYFLLPIRI
jgi:hypothetical protein